MGSSIAVSEVIMNTFRVTSPEALAGTHPSRQEKRYHPTLRGSGGLGFVEQLDTKVFSKHKGVY